MDVTGCRKNEFKQVEILLDLLELKHGFCTILALYHGLNCRVHIKQAMVSWDFDQRILKCLYLRMVRLEKVWSKAHKEF
jgi:hypothetical protein